MVRQPCKIKLTMGKYAIVDAEDFEYLNKYKWCTSMRNGKPYTARCLYDRKTKKRTTISMHRFLLGIIHSSVSVDHVNGNGLDNRKSNLRKCNHSQNMKNQTRHKNNKSGYKGVYWNKQKNKWAATIKVEGKSVHLGYFADKDWAAIAYNKAAQKFFKDFANLNKIRGRRDRP